MIKEIQFDKELNHFLTMVIEIWPTFNSGMKHLDQITSIPQHSFLPNRQYKLLSPQSFRQTIIKDFYQFIMSHDVKEQHIYDYMNDILDLLMIEEELMGGSNNPASVAYMSQYIFSAIKQLLEGNNKRIKDFQELIYNLVKGHQGQVIQDPNNPKDSSDQQQEYQSQDDYESIQQQQWNSQDEDDQQLNKEQKKEESKEKQLQDDGWNIVKNKKR